MNYKDFVEEYKKSQKKEEFVKEHVTVQYLPYATKKTEAQEIARLSSHIINDDGTEGMYRRDTAMQFFLTQVRLLICYTDIEIDTNEITATYDELCECGAIEVILEAIPSTERTVFTTMAQMAMDDAYTNEADVGIVLSTKLDVFKLTVDTALSAFGEIAKQNETVPQE